MFTVTVHRKEYERSEIIDISPEDSAKTAEKGFEPSLVSPNFTGKDSEKSSEKIIALFRENPKLSAREIAERIGISSRAVEKQIAALKEVGRLRHIGPAKGGHWELIE